LAYSVLIMADKPDVHLLNVKVDPAANGKIAL
jgi:hypothetical protein